MADSDRELLEWAARAAGHTEHLFWSEIHECFFWSAIYGDGTDFDADALWNPLNDDGDALRLAVMLRMEVNNVVPDAPVFVYAANPGMLRVTEEKHGDPYAATRRAIVRAAAAIGKGAGG